MSTTIKRQVRVFTDIAEVNEQDWKVARIKGNRVRYKHRATGQFSNWLRREPTISQVQSVSTDIEPSGAMLDGMKVADLRTYADTLGVKTTTKTKKVDIIDAIIVALRESGA